MRPAVDAPWQERFIKPKRPLSVRARLYWTLGLVVGMGTFIVGMALWNLLEAQRELGLVLARSTDPAASAIAADTLRRLDLVVRDLVLLAGAAGAGAVILSLSAARWLLHPVRRLSGHLQGGRGSEMEREGWVLNRDEVGTLARLLAAHLNEEADEGEVRGRSHRLMVQRLEAVLEQRAIMLAAVDKELRLTFLSRRLRDLLHAEDPVRRLPNLSDVWPDEALAAAIQGLRQSGDEFAAAFLTRQPLGGRAATLVRTGAPDAAEREILVIVSV